MSVKFEIVSEVTEIELIAAGQGIRDLMRLNEVHGEGRWRKLKGRALVGFPVGVFAARRFTGTRRTALGRGTSRLSVLRLTMAQHPRFAVCVQNAGNEASLELRKLYEIISDPDAEKDGMLRVIDESGEDYLFPAHFFVLAPLPAAVEKAVEEATAPAT